MARPKEAEMHYHSNVEDRKKEDYDAYASNNNIGDRATPVAP